MLVERRNKEACRILAQHTTIPIEWSGSGPAMLSDAPMTARDVAVWIRPLRQSPRTRCALAISGELPHGGRLFKS